MPTHHPTLFLRDEALRHGLSLLVAAHKDLTRLVDPILAKHGIGRAHHRALVVIREHPGLTVKGLFTRLDITKQSLSRVLNLLTELELIDQKRGSSDGREKALHLTAKGLQVEDDLFQVQRAKLMAAYREAGGDAVGGFWDVLEQLTGRKPNHLL